MAPASRMKITFLALFCVVTPAVAVSDSFAWASRGNRYDPVTPAPNSSKNWRRLTKGRLKKVLWWCGCRWKNCFRRCCSFMAVLLRRASVVEDEIHFVVERPEQVLGLLVAV